MTCERPDGFGIGLVRDGALKFPHDWVGNLPEPITREDLEQMYSGVFDRKRLNAEQREKALDFLVAYHVRYHEEKAINYHRECGGGTVVQGELGIYCSRCGKLPDLLPPDFLVR